MDSLHEEWRTIPGYEGQYEASSLGRVRSVDRLAGTIRPRFLRGRILKTAVQNAGYEFVFFLGRSFLVHRLIAWVFIGNRPNGLEVNHIDGNKLNNQSNNLEYVTRRENMEHARRIGIWDNRGERNGQAKATEDQIRHGVELVSSGMLTKDAAAIVGVRPGALGRVRTGKKWKHLGLADENVRRCPRTKMSDIEVVVSLRRSGKTFKAIVKETGLTTGTVFRICQKHNAKLAG